jgi:hypothetical protein
LDGIRPYDGEAPAFYRIRGHHCSRIRAWLRLHGRSVSITMNDLYPLGLREDEVSHSISSLPVWFSMATDNNRTTSGRMCNKQLSIYAT